MVGVACDSKFDQCFCCLKVDKVRIHYENLSLSSACEAALEIGNVGNLYMDQRAPWSLFKQGGTAAEAAAKVISSALYCMKMKLS